MHSDLFGGLWVVITLFIWPVTRQTTTSSPWTWYQAKNGSQPFSSELCGKDKLLAWCESLPVYLVTCATPLNVVLLHFWHPWLGSTLQHPSYQEENPGSGSKVGAVTEPWPFLKLQSFVVLGGKWLPFSLAGGISTFVKEPCWLCINGFPHDMTRKQLPETKYFILFLARAFAPIKNDCIWSFNSQPLISCLWLPNWVS